MTKQVKPIRRLYIDDQLCLGCKTCELRCAIERSSLSKTLYGAVNEQIIPRSRVYVQSYHQKPIPVQCRHCEDAACLEICSTGALRRDEESGCVYIQAKKCISCWMCIMVCPYGVIAPAVEKQAADKCDQCYQMAEPACLVSCPTGAIQLLTLDEIETQLKQKRLKAFA